MERGDIVVPKRGSYKGYAAVVFAVRNNGAEVNWLHPVPPREVYRHLEGHEHYDRFIDDLSWLDVVGHIDLDADSSAQEGEKQCQ